MTLNVCAAQAVIALENLISLEGHLLALPSRRPQTPGDRLRPSCFLWVSQMEQNESGGAISSWALPKGLGIVSNLHKNKFAVVA